MHVQNEVPVVNRNRRQGLPESIEVPVLVKRRQWLPERILIDIEDKAWKIYKTICAGKLLKSFRMAAFIGPENVGKTTLIN